MTRPSGATWRQPTIGGQNVSLEIWNVQKNGYATIKQRGGVQNVEVTKSEDVKATTYVGMTELRKEMGTVGRRRARAPEPCDRTRPRLRTRMAMKTWASRWRRPRLFLRVRVRPMLRGRLGRPGRRWSVGPRWGFLGRGPLSPGLRVEVRGNALEMARIRDQERST